MEIVFDILSIDVLFRGIYLYLNLSPLPSTIAEGRVLEIQYLPN